MVLQCAIHPDETISPQEEVYEPMPKYSASTSLVLIYITTSEPRETSGIDEVTLT